MRFAEDMDVFTAQGEKIGTLKGVVLDAKTHDVTDIVVARGILAGEEKVIPVGLVDLEDEEHIQLRETNQGVDDFLDYETTHYVPVDRVDEPYENIQASLWYPPTNLQLSTGSGMLPDVAPDRVLRTESSIPEGRVAISQGAEVFSADDKHIGDVEQVIMDSQTNQLTHFVVSKGLLLKEHKLVPAHWVDHVTEEKVYLSVQAPLFDHLPDYRAE
jgi:sporulation protein YlmC with PRC-barrel domain